MDKLKIQYIRNTHETRSSTALTLYHRCVFRNNAIASALLKATQTICLSSRLMPGIRRHLDDKMSAEHDGSPQRTVEQLLLP